MARRPLSRKTFLAKGGQLFGGAVAATSVLGRIRLDRLPHSDVRRAAGSAANPGSSLARLRAAYESNDVGPPYWTASSKGRMAWYQAQPAVAARSRLTQR